MRWLVVAEMLHDIVDVVFVTLLLMLLLLSWCLPWSFLSGLIVVQELVKLGGIDHVDAGADVFGV